eukprot:2979667-Rhodomonas_salina.1
MRWTVVSGAWVVAGEHRAAGGEGGAAGGGEGDARHRVCQAARAHGGGDAVGHPLLSALAAARAVSLEGSGVRPAARAPTPTRLAVAGAGTEARNSRRG